MSKYLKKELPIRAKVQMIKDVAAIIECLHRGQRSKSDPLFNDLKMRSIHLDEEIQQDVLIFGSQIAFQYDYDPWHKVTPDVQRAADHLLKSLGVNIF